MNFTLKVLTFWAVLFRSLYQDLGFLGYSRNYRQTQKNTRDRAGGIAYTQLQNAALSTKLPTLVLITIKSLGEALAIYEFQLVGTWQGAKHFC